MKAISPIIAIIIILLITIAIAGSGYSYISIYWSSLTDKQIQVVSSFCVDTGSQGKVMLRNIGTGSFDTSEITVINALTGEDITGDVLWGSDISDPGLILELRFDEGEGTKATDTSGQGNDGTLTGLPDWVDGKRSGALSFDGSGDYVDAGNQGPWNTIDNATVSLWLKANNVLGDQWVLSKYLDTADSWGIRVTSGSLRVYDDIDNANADYYATALSNDVWYHVAVVMEDNGAGTYENKLYIGGDLIDNGENSLDSWSSFIGNLYIGSIRDNDAFFNGILDEVRIYNRALSGDEVKALADNSVSVQAGQTAAFTHTCSGLCQYNIVLGGGSKEAMLEC